MFSSFRPILRFGVQAVALIIFGYQMVVAMNKYLANSTIATVETKSIEDARLPDLYFCINDASLDNRFQEHGYYEIYHFLQGRDICFAN